MKGQQKPDWTKTGIEVAAIWLAAGLTLSFFLGVSWTALGDLDYATAMVYHGLMVPLLVMFYLLTVRIWPLEILRRRIYGAGAIAAVLLAGPAATFNTSAGLSAAAVVQVAGMAITDVLGIALLAALGGAAFKGPDGWRRPDTVACLLLSSVAAIALAAPFGHFAGWAIDFGIDSLPGMAALVGTAGMRPSEFQEGLISSHSHLIVAAMITGLIALAAKSFRYEGIPGLRRHVVRAGAGLMLIGLWAAAGIYVISALTGWEPPACFVSGPAGENGVPLDDIVLGVTLGASLLLTGALIRGPARNDVDGRSEGWIRAAVFFNCLCAFVGSVVLGLSIEFNETFYGGGELPAPGAANDLAFIRAHLLYPFLLLPVLLVFLVAIGPHCRRSPAVQALSSSFLLLSVAAMALGLVGEFMWVVALDNTLFLNAMRLSAGAVVAGALGLLSVRPLTPQGRIVS